MKPTKSWNELCGIVRNTKYGFTYYTPESMITHCYEIGEKREGELGSSGEPREMVKEKQLEYCIWEHMITDVFQVGHITVKLVGEEHPNRKTERIEVDGKMEWKVTPLPGTKGKFYMYRTEDVEAIDIFRIDNTGTRHPIDDSHYCSREEITALAQKHSDIIEKRSEDVTVNFPTGIIYAANYFCENRDEGFDDLPKDIKYNNEFSINHAVGRQATAQWLADNRNMAYGQLGNTYCSVWKINDDKLVVTRNDPYVEVWEEHEDPDDTGWYEKELPAPEGWEFVGGICCDVWRVELVDAQGMTDYGFDLDKFREEHEHKEVLKTTVNPGEWEMRTYYNQRSDAEIQKEFGYPIWAELNRKV